MIINKVMGYGLSGVSHNPATFQADDSRIDTNVLTGLQSRHEKYSDNEFANYLFDRVGDFQDPSKMKQASADDLMAYFVAKTIQEDGYNGFRFADGVIYDPETADPETLLIVPYASHEKWIRRDDDMDYAEYDLMYRRFSGLDFRPVVQVLPNPLYPYDVFMNASTGEVLDNRQHNAIGLYRKMKANLSKPVDHSIIDLLRAGMLSQAVKAGFRDEDDFLMNCVPAIPDEIKDFVKMTGLFTDDRIILQLRPMIMTYWA